MGNPLTFVFDEAVDVQFDSLCCLILAIQLDFAAME
jgi:hypothetical protein